MLQNCKHSRSEYRDPNDPAKKLSFPQICPKMPWNGPKMAKNDPKCSKVTQIWPKMAQEWPKMAQKWPALFPQIFWLLECMSLRFLQKNASDYFRAKMWERRCTCLQTRRCHNSIFSFISRKPEFYKKHEFSDPLPSSLVLAEYIASFFGWDWE